MDISLLMRYATKLMLGFALIVLNHDAMAVDIGQPIPACDLADHSGEKAVDLQTLKGQVVYVDFWASWCIPCSKSFPFMNRLHKELKDKGLHIVGVNVDEEHEEAEQFLKALPADFQVLMDKESLCAKNFQVKAMPSTYIIDRKGIVRLVHVGFREGEAAALEDQVKQLLAESP